MSDCTPPADCPPPHNPISVALARALAEAADGFPGWEQVYVIANYTPVSDEKGFHIRGPITDWNLYGDEEVKQKIRNGELGFFGPFNTTAAPMPKGVAVERIDVHFRDGKTHEFTGHYTDALFFSVQAVEKFALPYYEHIYGPEYAARVRDQFLASEQQVMAHFPWSEYIDPPPKPPTGPKPPVPPTGPALLRPDGAGGATLVPAGAAEASAPPA